MPLFDRLVLVIKPAELDSLLARFASRSAVQYFLESRGQTIGPYEAEASSYARALEALLQALPPIPYATIARADLPHFLWREKDLAIAIGPDGLVINVAKYLDGQPVLGVNPNPSSIEGKLVRFMPVNLKRDLEAVLAGRYLASTIATLEARLNDGRVLRAVNDFLVGRLDQVSARYRITVGGHTERQSSSGVLVSSAMGTGAWLKSLLTGAARIAAVRLATLAPTVTPETIADAMALDLGWDDRTLVYAVREPFPTRATAASLVFGTLAAGKAVDLASDMPEGGVLVSDGVVEDFVPFNAGASVAIASAERLVTLITATR